MSGAFGSSQWMYASGAAGFYPYSIDQSLRFNNDDSAFLKRDITTTSNRKTWTWSAWVKRSSVSTRVWLFGDGKSSSLSELEFQANDTLYASVFDGSAGRNKVSTQLFRDVGAWYHIVWRVDTTQATPADRNRVYINGQQITDWSTENNPNLNSDSTINVSGNDHVIGAYSTGSNTFDGYMAEVNFIDGIALDPTSFGEEVNGVWRPVAYSGSYGTNGFYLSFADSAAIGDDLSGNTNDFTANNLAASDVMTGESPTNNFATYNPLPNSSSFRANLSNGNLYNNPGNNCTGFGTISLTTGKKWYMEGIATNAYNTTMGIFEINDANAIQNSLNTIYYNNTSYKSAFYHRDGTKYIDGVNSSYGAAFTTGDLIGMAVDLESATNTVTFYKNNVSQGSFNLGANGLDYLFCMSRGSSGGGWHMNFGQDDTFAGTITAGGNSDDNGIGTFKYAPPSGFLALCSANLPEPTISPNAEAQADDYFNTVLWSGNSTNNRSITTDHATDFVWIKKRGTTVQSHVLADSVRGTSDNGGTGNVGILSSNLTNAESTNSSDSGIASFDSTGFTIGAGSNTANADAPYQGTNASGHTYVGWSWKAGGTAVSNTNGSITSSVSAAPDAGFSIVTYASTTGTVGHGLTQAPEAIIMKATNVSDQWTVGHKDLNSGSSPWNYGIPLNTTASTQTNSGFWNNTAPTSTVFSQGSWDSGYNKVAYCFHSVDGFSKVGSYVGNGSADGTFVALNFSPAFILTKRANATGGWIILDSERDSYNVSGNILQTESTAAELPVASYPTLDILSNGFKVRSSSIQNVSGSTYIYLAFAEAPFKYANAR